jgi:nicotinamidase-related amidase
MAMRIWDNYLTERDKAVHAASQYGKRGGFGKRPAILVVDVNYAFVGDRPEPILDSIVRWHNSCGTEGWEAMEIIRELLRAGRARGLPVIYSTSIRRKDRWDDGGWAWKSGRVKEKSPANVAATVDGHRIPDMIKPDPTDIIIRKQKPSMFFGTNLVGYLTDLGVDSVIVVGTTTSGCVRASVIDAFSYNLRVTVVEDGCFDRTQASHAINLFDMDAKYCDVIGSAEVLGYIESLPANMFALPSGAGMEGVDPTP